jgi:di/tricarboxylate transporter
VSALEEARPLRHDRAPLSLALLGLFVALVISGTVDIATSAMLAAVLMVVTRCISTADARRSIYWQTVITIGAAFGIGKALEVSGAAKVIAGLVVHSTASWGGPVVVLAAIYLVTMVMTELLSNSAAAALMFPFAVAIATQLGVSPRPFAIAIMFAASLAFATPVGYQTNLMVYGPGGYRFTDFTRVGLPLNVLVWVLCSLLIPVFWPFNRF